MREVAAAWGQRGWEDVAERCCDREVGVGGAQRTRDTCGIAGMHRVSIDSEIEDRVCTRARARDVRSSGVRRARELCAVYYQRCLPPDQEYK